MPHVIWHCNGVGPVEGTDTVPMPHYKHGISTYAWAPPHDMPRGQVLKIDERLESLRQRQLDLIAKATGGTIYGDPIMHEEGEEPPHDH
jgi:hypothetical protein